MIFTHHNSVLYVWGFNIGHQLGAGWAIEGETDHDSNDQDDNGRAIMLCRGAMGLKLHMVPYLSAPAPVLAGPIGSIIEPITPTPTQVSGNPGAAGVDYGSCMVPTQCIAINLYTEYMYNILLYAIWLYSCKK